MAGLEGVIESLNAFGRGRPLPMAPKQRLTASVDDHWIRWTLGKWNRRHDPPIVDFDHVLLNFVALANGSREKILQFAQTYGMLGLCGAHPDLPMFHNQGCLLPAYDCPYDLNQQPHDEQEAQKRIESIVFKEHERPGLFGRIASAQY